MDKNTVFIPVRDVETHANKMHMEYPANFHFSDKPSIFPSESNFHDEHPIWSLLNSMQIQYKLNFNSI